MEIDDSTVEEILERLKTMETAILHTENPSQWSGIKGEVLNRLSSLGIVTERVKAIFDTELDKPITIAATELFVEKAQTMLTYRARCFLMGGVVCGMMAMGILGYLALHLDCTSLLDVFKDLLSTVSTGANVVTSVDTKIVIVQLVKSSTLAALVIGMAVFLGDLSKSFFHESTVLYNRRHALRFGRLYVYVRGGKVTLDELQRAFHWNDEFSTAFKNIKTEIQAPADKLFDKMGEVLRAVTKNADGK